MSDLEVNAVEEMDEIDGGASIDPVSTGQDAASAGIDPASVLRIEDDVVARWSGVSGCCSGDRPQRELTAQYDQWVGQQIKAHPDMVHLRSGHGGGEARCRSSREPWPSNRRSCGGSVTVKAFIEFAPR